MTLGKHVQVLLLLVAALAVGQLGWNSPTRADAARRSPEVPAAAPAPAYLTLVFGRSQWEQRDPTCTSTLPRSITLGQVARALHRRGLTGSAIAVVDWTSTARTRTCRGRLAYASWSDLAALRDTYGWTMVSGGMSHADLTTMTTKRQRAESCGSLRAFTDHGHRRAAGLFAYGNNKHSAAIQSGVVSTCFSYGRVYGAGLNTVARLDAPWFQSTVSYNGGACNDRRKPCSKLSTHGGRRYAPPRVVRAMMQPGPRQWSAVQFYRFVTGSRRAPADPTFAWDCTGSAARLHWTSRAEIYCWKDYKSALDAIPSTVTVTDPLTVARAWGRTVP
jgi:hypothetical protein